MTTKVNEDNSVQIPAALAKEMGIAPGTCLDWKRTEEPGSVVVSVVPDWLALAKSLQGAGRKLREAGQDPVKTLLEERVREDEERRASL